MYCSNCGNKIDNSNKYCVYCGIKLDKIGLENTSNIVKKEENGLRIVSIVLGILGIIGSVTFIFFVYAFILSVVGLILGICATKKGRNVLGIVLNSVGLVLSIIMFCLFIYLMFYAGSNDYDDYDDYYDDRYEYNYGYDNYYEKFKDIISDF